MAEEKEEDVPLFEERTFMGIPRRAALEKSLKKDVADMMTNFTGTEVEIQILYCNLQELFDCCVRDETLVETLWDWLNVQINTFRTVEKCPLGAHLLALYRARASASYFLYGPRSEPNRQFPFYPSIAPPKRKRAKKYVYPVPQGLLATPSSDAPRPLSTLGRQPFGTATSPQTPIGVTPNSAAHPRPWPSMF